MGKNRTDEFLDLYSRLEKVGRDKYFPKASPGESIIGRLMSLAQLHEFKEDIDFCRIVRNFIVHTPRVSGSYPIEPSDEMVEFMRGLVEKISNPLKAIDYAVRINNMYNVDLKSNIVDVVQHMQLMGFTHVPVLDNGRLFGVFSANVLYTYLSKTNDEVKSFDAEMSILSEYLPVHKHTNEYFAFMSCDKSLYEVSQLFKIDVRSMKQLAAVFLTENGRADEKILAMLTPYSILRDAPDHF